MSAKCRVALQPLGFNSLALLALLDTKFVDNRLRLFIIINVWQTSSMYLKAPSDARGFGFLATFRLPLRFPRFGACHGRPLKRVAHLCSARVNEVWAALRFSLGTAPPPLFRISILRHECVAKSSAHRSYGQNRLNMGVRWVMLHGVRRKSF